MAQPVGTVPEFTQDDTPITPEPVQEEVKEATPEPVVEEVKDTPIPPVEKPQEAPVADLSKEENALRALQEERVKLLKEISELRGTRREIKQEQVRKVEQRIDELKDVNPDDVAIIEKVMRSKGMVTKEEAHQMFYDAVKNEELNKFLDKYPEYKPENDKDNTNWELLQREIGYYRMPDDPHLVGQILEKAHRAIPRAPVRDISAQKHQIQVASSGSRGVQRSSPQPKAFDTATREMYRRGGWSEDEIKNMESRLTD